MSIPRLLLGSSSRYRAELLGRLGVPFDQASPDVDERAYDDRFASLSNEEFATTLALAKARALARPGARPDEARWILCADQIGVLGEDRARVLLSKPVTPERCVEQLMSMSGRTHELVTGVVLWNESTSAYSTCVDRQVMTMRAFQRDEAEAYVRAYAPLDCAGGYRIEDAGIALFERIRGDDYTGIIGLPLLATARLLRAAGVLS